MTARRRNFSISEQKKHLIDWEQSGLSKVTYCEQHCISSSVFYRWLNKFKRKQTQELQLVPLDITNQIHCNNSSTDSSISIPIGKYKIIINDNFCSSTFVQILKTLESL